MEKEELMYLVKQLAIGALMCFGLLVACSIGEFFYSLCQ